MIFLLSALALPIAFSLMISKPDDGAGYFGVAFGYLVPGAPALFSFWFIGQEKMKGTFKFLSILPIPGRQLILAKSLASALLCLSIINVVVLLMPLMMQAAIGLRWFPGLQTILWVNLLTLLFVAVDATIFTLLESKIASQAIYLGHTFLALIVLVAIKLMPTIGESDTLLQRLYSISFHYWGWIPVILIAYLLVVFSGRVFEMREWTELEED